MLSRLFLFDSTEEETSSNYFVPSNNMFHDFTLVVMGILGNVFGFIAPLWIAVIFGVVVGWAWKPKWAIEPNSYDWNSFFKFRVPWSSDSELQNQPGFSDRFGFSFHLHLHLRFILF